MQFRSLWTPGVSSTNCKNKHNIVFFIEIFIFLIYMWVSSRRWITYRAIFPVGLHGGVHTAYFPEISWNIGLFPTIQPDTPPPQGGGTYFIK